MKPKITLGSADRINEDIAAILTWIIITKYDGVLNLPDREELFDSIKNYTITLDPNNALIRVTAA